MTSITDWLHRWLQYADLAVILVVATVVAALDPAIWRTEAPLRIIAASFLTGLIVGVAMGISGFPDALAYAVAIPLVFIGPAGLYALRGTRLEKLAAGYEWIERRFGKGRGRHEDDAR